MTLDQENEIMGLYALGFNGTEIASRLGVSRTIVYDFLQTVCEDATVRMLHEEHRKKRIAEKRESEEYKRVHEASRPSLTCVICGRPASNLERGLCAPHWRAGKPWGRA